MLNWHLIKHFSDVAIGFVAEVCLDNLRILVAHVQSHLDILKLDGEVERATKKVFQVVIISWLNSRLPRNKDELAEYLEITAESPHADFFFRCILKLLHVHQGSYDDALT